MLSNQVGLLLQSLWISLFFCQKSEEMSLCKLLSPINCNCRSKLFYILTVCNTFYRQLQINNGKSSGVITDQGARKMPAWFFHRLVLHISCICFQNIKIVCGKFSTEKVCECFFQVLLIIQLSLYNQIISNLMESTTFVIYTITTLFALAGLICRR